MTKTSILIPDGESTLTKHVVQCLSEDRNLEIHVLSKDPNASIKHSKWIRSFNTYDLGVINNPEADFVSSGDDVIDELVIFHHYDPSRSEQLIAEITRCIEKTKAQIIFPIDEHIVKILSAHKERIEKIARLAPIADYETFTMAIDKWRLAEFLKKHSGPHPSTVKYSEGVSEKTIRELSFPVIIKPIDQGNAQGIRSFDNADELWSFFKNQKLNHQYIIQPLIDGYDIDCSVLCSGGKVCAYTIQKGISWSANRYAAAVGIEFLYEQEVLQVVETMMKQLNWSGVAHIDLRYDRVAKQIKIIEINARYWGSLLGSLNAGVNFPLLALKIVKGEAFDRKDYKFNRYFMGKSPLRKLLTGRFSSDKDRIRFRDTSLYYTFQDPKPFFFEVFNKYKRKFQG